MSEDEILQIPVVLKKLHGRIRGFTCLGSDYSPIIVINEDMSPEQQRITYLHELQHIEHGDLWNPDYNEYGDAV